MNLGNRGSVTYTVQIKKSALKVLRKLPTTVSKSLAKTINFLEKTPRPKGCKKLKGNENLYRIQQGDYRIIYQVQDSVLIILIVIVGHRKMIYRKL